MNVLTRTLARVLAEAPVSLRELARRSGVSHVLLVRIVAGQRNATPEVARAVATALAAIGAEAERGAVRVRRSLNRGGKP